MHRNEGVCFRTCNQIKELIPGYANKFRISRKCIKIKELVPDLAPKSRSWYPILHSNQGSGTRTCIKMNELLPGYASKSSSSYKRGMQKIKALVAGYATNQGADMHPHQRVYLASPKLWTPLPASTVVLSWSCIRRVAFGFTDMNS